MSLFSCDKKASVANMLSGCTRERTRHDDDDDDDDRHRHRHRRHHHYHHHHYHRPWFVVYRKVRRTDWSILAKRSVPLKDELF